jgi:hypothetical protein
MVLWIADGVVLLAVLAWWLGRLRLRNEGDDYDDGFGAGDHRAPGLPG